MILSKKAESVAQEAILAEEAKRSHIVVALSGAHAYGFPSPDSDLDLKSIHIAPTENLLGLHPRCPASESIREVEGIELDYSSNELGGVLLGILKGNGNYLERVLGKHILHTTDEHAQLRELTLTSLSKRSYRHYRGFAWQQRKDFESTRTPTVKNLLYVLRTALTGIHLLRTGVLVADLALNAEEHGYIDALELIEAKKAGEQTLLSEPLCEAWASRLNTLFESLDDAVIASPLPEESTNEAEFEEWLLSVRVRDIASRLGST